MQACVHACVRVYGFELVLIAAPFVARYRPLTLDLPRLNKLLQVVPWRTGHHLTRWERSMRGSRRRKAHGVRPLGEPYLVPLGAPECCADGKAEILPSLPQAKALHMPVYTRAHM